MSALWFKTLFICLFFCILCNCAAPARQSREPIDSNNESVALFDQMEGIYKTIDLINEKLEYEKRKLQNEEEYADAGSAQKEKIRRRLTAHLRPGGQASAMRTMSGRSNRLGSAWVEHAMTETAELSNEVAVLRASLQKAIEQGAPIHSYQKQMNDLVQRAENLLNKVEAMSTK